MRARVIIAGLSVPLLAIGLVLALDVPPKLGIVFSAPEWGYTLFSLGADIALVYLIIDFLLLREERQRWKSVEGKATELVKGQLQSILVVVFSMVKPVIDISSSKEEKMSRMRELADPAKLRSAMRPLDSGLSSLFQRLSRGIGDLQLRYSSRLDPTLINILIDIENSLASMSVSLALAKLPPITIDSAEAAWPPFLDLIAALVKAADGGFVELPYVSRSI
jgi:hypothetical protein